MSKYASNTTVSVERSIEEIKKTLKRYGYHASGWLHSEDSDTHMEVLMFKVEGRMICYRFPMLSPDDFLETPTGRERSWAQAEKVCEQARRQRWRAILLSIKSRLEEVESGITSFERAFLDRVMLPNGATVGQRVAPQVEEAYLTGQMPPLLPAIIKH